MAALSLTEFKSTSAHKGRREVDICRAVILFLLHPHLKTEARNKQKNIQRNTVMLSCYISTIAERSKLADQHWSTPRSLRCNFSNTHLISPTIHLIPLERGKKKKCHQHIDGDQKEEHCSDARALGTFSLCHHFPLANPVSSREVRYDFAQSNTIQIQRLLSTDPNLSEIRVNPSPSHLFHHLYI